MAFSDFSKKSTCTFLWKIENVNYIWLKTLYKIESPVFVVDVLENTKWVMRLYPRGRSSANKIGFYLQRKDDGSSTDDIEVNFELAFLSGCGKTLCSSRSVKHTFSKDSIVGFDFFAHQSTVFSSIEYLPLNTFNSTMQSLEM
ncbi:TD and POZ domain-containing protein 3 [Trichonephila clavata]|uniref:TD and POZ domain-containing protein 3 n=1 Tax=Trichonephila clavata TaxID=2740835 RepID=A0A8X6KZJ8_TRICU|nr:TD and POZ domain-containing protein 3 [Trichonephila clavata]